MREFIFISSTQELFQLPRNRFAVFFRFFLIVFIGFNFVSHFSFSQSEFDPVTNSKPKESTQSGAEDFKETPFTQYGDFNEADEESEAALFFKYGRFFGISVGVGFHGTTGNRALLWQGGFPLVDIRLHYWFDLQLALQLEFYNVSHYYEFGSEQVDVAMTHFGVDLKYYIDTRNLSAPISFASPYLLIGGGNFSKSESNVQLESVDTDSKFGVSVGAGLEFPISHRNTYFVVEGKVHFINFEDRLTGRFQPNIENLSGLFYMTTFHFLFTY